MDYKQVFFQSGFNMYFKKTQVSNLNFLFDIKEEKAMCYFKGGGVLA